MATIGAVGTALWVGRPNPSVLAPAPVVAPTVNYHWDFNSPDVSGVFKVDVGSWHHVPGGGADGLGCMETDETLFSVLVDVPIAGLPIQVSYRASAFVNPKPAGEYMTATYWFPSRETVLFMGFSEYTPETISAGQERGRWLEYRQFLDGVFMDSWKGSNEHVGFALDRAEKGSRLKFYSRGRHQIDDLRIQTIAAKDLPDVSRFLAAVERIPPEKRVGRVELVELRSTKTGRPVYAEFHKGR